MHINRYTAATMQQALAQVKAALGPEAVILETASAPGEVTVEIGRTRLAIRELLELGPGSVIELQKLAGETLDVLINGKPIARGEAVMVNDKFGVRLTDVASPSERIAGLG